MAQVSTDKGNVLFVYDGDCPICQVAARGLRIEKVVGQLNLIDLRSDKNNPVVREINDKGLNLDEGMVIKCGGNSYHGADTLQIMASFGTNQGWFN